MNKTIIDKAFHWEGGHRVWTQSLDPKYTSRGDACHACKRLHGHSYLLKVFLEETEIGTNIKDTGMVMDFKMMGFVKDFVDDVLDHKSIFDINDPLLEEELSYLLDDDGKLNLIEFCHKMPEGYWIPNLTKLRKTLDSFINKFNFSKDKAEAIMEKYEGINLVDFTPTSENLANWLLTIIEEKLKDLEHVKVNAVEIWETPKSHARVEVS